MRSKNGSGRHGIRVIGIGKFGTWLEKNMRERNLTCQDLANILDVSRQKIMLHVKCKTYVDFPNVIAYCWVFGMKDDPNEIYKLVKEDWEQ